MYAPDKTLHKMTQVTADYQVTLLIIQTILLGNS